MTKYVLTGDPPLCAKCGSTDYFRLSANKGEPLICGTCTDRDPRPGEQERAILKSILRQYGLPSDRAGTT